jgi:nucleoside-diphosphate-sugar epimerase
LPNTASFGKIGALKALVVGCGYVGTALGRALVERGDAVAGVCPSEKSVASLQVAGIEPVIADITSLDSLRRIKPEFDAVVDCVSSSRKGEDGYREVYLRGTHNLLEWVKASPPGILVFTSSTTVYAQADGEWVDETSPTEPPHESGKILLEAERLFLASGLPVTILRLAGIYGPGRHAMLDKLRQGAPSLPGDGGCYVNVAHRDDIVSALVAALDRRPAGRIFNVADDEPTLQLEYLHWLCDQLRRPMVTFHPHAERKFKRGLRRGFTFNRRISNRAMKTVLGVTLRYPNFRDGLRPIIENLP